jgi:transcriptional regulator GlxA family with amidase domain
MWLAMLAGMLLFHALPASHTLPPPLHQLGMAGFMAAPMVLWMRVRGHSWHHGAEMAAGMLVPWAVVMSLVAAGAASMLPWLAQAGNAAMLLGMLAVMLVRRDHYTHGGSHQHSAAPAASRPAGRVPWRNVLMVAAYLVAIMLVPVLAATANLAYKFLEPHEPLEAPAYSGALPAPPPPDPNKKIAVVLSGPRGAEIGDTLEAYEILARSGVFNVYSLAPERTVLPLLPGPAPWGSSLDFVPHFSFAEYDAQIGRPPDLIAIPYFDGSYTPERDAAVLAWIRTHFGPNTTILGICSGNMILADTGLLAGRSATTNTGTFPYVESHAPTATWLHNLRYVDDGNIVTSSNLTAGIDATLHVVDRVAGRATALDVARQIGYTQTGALDDPRFDPPEDTLTSRVIRTGFEGPTQQMGVLLYDGVTELGLSGLVDPYAASFSARTFVMAPERRIVPSRDGFLFLPRYDFRTVPALDRVLVPAGEGEEAKQQAVAAWSRVQPRRSVEDIYRNVGLGETAYDVSLRDLARTHNLSLARTVADTLFYPTSSQVSAVAWPVAEVLTALALGLLGAGAVFAASRMVALRRAPQAA